jgi:hypothetical protein
LPALAVAAFVLAPMPAQAQVNVTPNFSITPSSATTKWIIWMALGAIVLAVLVLIGVGVSYLRFAPKFFGREEAPKRLPPGARPPLLTQAGRPQPPAATRPAAAQASPARAATAVAERPVPAARPEPAAAAAAAPGPAAAPETAAPEASRAPVEGAPAPPAAEATPAPAEAAPTPAAAEATPAAAEPAPNLPAAASAAAPQPAAHGSAAALDQETFDRVLEEQLGKGVDRRVAEGRARAAAVVAARKKAQG